MLKMLNSRSTGEILRHLGIYLFYYDRPKARWIKPPQNRQSRVGYDVAAFNFDGIRNIFTQIIQMIIQNLRQDMC